LVHEQQQRIRRFTDAVRAGAAAEDADARAHASQEARGAAAAGKAAADTADTVAAGAAVASDASPETAVAPAAAVAAAAATAQPLANAEDTAAPPDAVAPRLSKAVAAAEAAAAVEAAAAAAVAEAVYGFTGRALRNVVSVGIGGSYLGPCFVSEVLATEREGIYTSQGFTLRFLSNVDPVDFERWETENRSFYRTATGGHARGRLLGEGAVTRLEWPS
jgi:hypothetical protein